MFGNNRELPPGFIVRRASNSDISDILKFLQNEFSIQRNESPTQIVSLIITLIALGLILLYLLFINGFLVTGFFHILFAVIIMFLIIFSIFSILPYFHWNHMIESGECLLIIHQNNIRAVIATSNFNNYSYIRFLLVSHSYRRRGLGTYLINTVRQNLNYPIYLFCLPEPYLVEFYSSNGFFAIEKNQIPRKIRQDLKNTSEVIPMILEEN